MRSYPFMRWPAWMLILLVETFLFLLLYAPSTLWRLMYVCARGFCMSACMSCLRGKEFNDLINRRSSPVPLVHVNNVSMGFFFLLAGRVLTRSVNSVRRSKE